MSPPDLVRHEPGGWRALAACSAGPSTKFFPPSEEQVGEAKAVCASCSVRLDCLAYAIATGPAYGIWGGLDSYQLEAMRRAHSRPDTLLLGPDQEMLGLLNVVHRPAPS